MLNKFSKLKNCVKDLYDPVEHISEEYLKIVEEINRIKLDCYSDSQLKAMSGLLKSRIHKRISPDELLVEAFALVKEAARRVLGITPFDVQLIAALVIYQGKIAEMQTGEGKTLAAVFPAYLQALSGKGVHVLTFNDYLAQRDAQWMGPVYESLGMTVSFVIEGMSTEERKKAYSCDITYLTAKESGFDYLRDFLCVKKEMLVHREFNFAIVDEADSILIDEARIPLVISGDVPSDEESLHYLSELVKGLKPWEDYEIDQQKSNVHLTDAGLLYVENLLGCNNLYEVENLELLTKLNCALHAELLLERDVDYIVRNGQIEIIDEFTGRIADNRHWPDNLHAAVEAKEGVESYSKGTIMGSVALQYFLSLYPRLAGMTGTARTAVVELRRFYNLDVVAIPTNKPSIRIDHPDVVFTHKEAKLKAIVAEIKRAHSLGQPILVGTGSIEESEQLSEALKKEGIKCELLNAKNDEMEAGIIANAGRLGTVTVSTNMAGRGVDIKLGGQEELDKDKVAALGGLYVIGTNRHESIRIDNQLRGRAGRQGDPGESRFFISLEDELIKKYNMTQLLPSKYLNEKLEHPIDDAIVLREVARGQRIVEGHNSDMRGQLWRYSYMLEQQRRIIHNTRQAVLMDKKTLGLLKSKSPVRYIQICDRFGDKLAASVEKQLTLYFINKCWADYLDYIAYIREGIHLVVIGRLNPLHEYNKLAVEGFDKMLRDIEDNIVNSLNEVEITEKGVDMEKEGLKGPSSTWTYLMNESPDQFSRLPHLVKAVTTMISSPLFTLSSIFKKLMRKKM